MATFSGNNGVVRIASDSIKEVMSFTVNQNMEPIDDTVMGDSWRTHLAGLKTWDGTVECRWDDTDTAGQGALSIGASVTLDLYPEGISGYKLSGLVSVTSISQTQSYDNTTVTRTFTFQGNGALNITPA